MTSHAIALSVCPFHVRYALLAYELQHLKHHRTKIILPNHNRMIEQITSNCVEYVELRRSPKLLMKKIIRGIFLPQVMLHFN